MRKTRGWWIPIALALASALTAYVGAYYALCVPSPCVCSPTRVTFAVSQYRHNPLGQRRCEWLFAPLHQLDRHHGARVARPNRIKQPIDRFIVSRRRT